MQMYVSMVALHVLSLAGYIIYGYAEIPDAVPGLQRRYLALRKKAIRANMI